MISIVIIVKNDPKIATLLEKIESFYTSKKVEIIVVDASGHALDNIRKLHSKVKWINYSNKHKERTYAEQRNLGVKHSLGSIIVFIDSDCIPSKDWLTLLTKPILKGDEIIVSGAVKPLEKNSVHIEEKYNKYRDECETMNLAIAKEVFKKVGYFDENLEGCEDSDFCIRARKQGYKIRFIQEAFIYHDWGGFTRNISRSFHGGRDRLMLYRKHAKQLIVPSINNIYTLFYLLYILSIPLFFFFPVPSLILFVPSIIKRRNPIKEIYNLFFAAGMIKQAVKLVV